MKRNLWLCAVCSCLALLLLSTGCNKITADSVRGNMSPELTSVALTNEQHKNELARSVDHTARQWHDDWDSLLLLDRPRRMSKYPIP